MNVNYIDINTLMLKFASTVLKICTVCQRKSVLNYDSGISFCFNIFITLTIHEIPHNITRLSWISITIPLLDLDPLYKFLSFECEHTKFSHMYGMQDNF